MKQANQDRGTLLLALVAAYRLMVLSQRCLAPLYHFLYPDYFPGADGLLPASTLS